MQSRPLILCILDGWGYRADPRHNAIAAAHLPTWNHILQNYPNTLLEASAHSVGLPEGQMGNSEVGHMNIGAGRLVLQDLPRIDQAIKDKSFTSLPDFKLFVQKMKQSFGSCHMVGLLSPGGIHSHQNHIIAFAKALVDEGITVKVHAFLDGRDTSPRSGYEYVENFLAETRSPTSLIQLVSIGGRYYGMDRDQRWDRIEKAYQTIALGQGPYFDNPLDYIQRNYDDNIGDEFIVPALAPDYYGIQEGDGLLYMNFRADRVRQLLSALVLPDFVGFKRGGLKNFTIVAGLSDYSEELNAHCWSFFPSLEIHNTLGDIVSQQGLKQLRVAETEKYAHVTFFFNGGQEKVFPGEDRLLIPSPLVTTYDLKPEMSAVKLTQKLIDAAQKNHYDLIVVNFANADMVGHSGNFEATIKAVETIDQCLKKVCDFIDETEGLLVITADHGNAEQLYDEGIQQPHTAHTINAVPFVLYGKREKSLDLHSDGKLCDIAPTILALLQISQPSEMSGKNLIF